MEEYRKYILALRKCAIEHDNDETSFAHIIVSDLCRDTADLLGKLEQEPSRDMEEIKEVINCDADAETKCKMISNILTAKLHYFEEPFINKPCVSSEVCEHDKQKVLDKIRAEIDAIYKEDMECDGCSDMGMVLDIIDKYKAESEG